MLNFILSFTNNNEQDVYLQGLIQTSNKDDHEQIIPNPGQQIINIDNKRRNICKKDFLSLFGIFDKRVRRLASLLVKNEIPHDKRGENIKGNATSSDICLQIREHIDSLPKKEVHYYGKSSQYLDAQLNVKIMHKLFNEKYPDTSVKYKFYNNFFKETFSL